MDPKRSAEFSAPFSVRDALADGFSRERLRAGDLRAAFHGTRSPRGSASTVASACAELQTVLDHRHAFTAVTAGLLWGVPLPLRFARATELFVASVAPTRPIRHRRTIASQRPASWRVVERDGLRVHAPAETWGSLAAMLTEADLTAVGDFLVTPLRHRPAWSRVSDLEEFLDRAGGITGIGRLRSSLLRVRVGARSRPESLLRLLLEDAGLPTALINPEYRLLSGRVVFPDLAWPDHRVAVEYDGGYHRDADQFVRDIVRTDEMVDEGWHVVHVVAAQLFDRPEEVVERVAQRLASRGAEPISMTRLARFER